MANADLTPSRPAPPAALTRAATAKRPAGAGRAADPLQQKLAGLEAKLPAALTRQAVALALSIVVMLAAFAGFGSAKVRSKYNTAPAVVHGGACLPTTATTSARN